jgi:D-alanyl-D-alanine carboxypeptidase
MRMLSSLALCFVACLLFGAVTAEPASAQASPGDRSVRAAIDAVVQKERKIFGGRTPIPGVLIEVSDKTGNYVRAYGYADLTKHRNLTAQDYFRIGSNTKTFVISVLLQLVDEDKLRLDDPLSTFALGVDIPNAQNISVRELCQMRSGLFEAYDTPEIGKLNVTGKSTFDARTLVKWAVRQKPLFAPGTKYNYSNTNYLILGLIIEAITKDTVAHQIEDRLLRRFGLSHTSYPETQAMPTPWAHGYGLNAKNAWEDISGTVPVSLIGAAGEMVSDMQDMTTWTKLYVTGKTNSAATQKERLDCVYTGKGNNYFGLGIGCSAGYFGYTGGLPGYNTANFYEPSTGTMILAWVTVQNDKPEPGAANTIAREIARILTPDHVPFLLTAEPAHTQSRGATRRSVSRN